MSKAAAGLGLKAAQGIMAGSAAKKAQKREIAAAKENIALEHSEGRIDTQYETELSDYYDQLGKQRRRDARGASFDKYSSIPLPEPPAEGEEVAPVSFRQPLVSTRPVLPPKTETVTPKKKKK
ncbi:MAG: hypothetical protein AB7H19_12295 [Porticoccaceae bacterium]